MSLSIRCFSPRTRRTAIYVVAVLGFYLAVFGLFPLDSTEARSEGDKRGGLPNYDIRSDKTAANKIAEFRRAAGKTLGDVAGLRAGFTRGEDSLKRRVSGLKVEYNAIGVPEIIAPDLMSGTEVLARRPSVSRVDSLRSFLSENSDLIGARSTQVVDLKAAADYTNPDGKLSFVELEQEINGVPVFGGEVKAGFNSDGQLFRVVNNLAPGVDAVSVSGDFGNAADAVITAGDSINRKDGSVSDLPVDYTRSDANKTFFGEGESATTAEKMYFPIEPGVVVPAWRVLIWQPASAYYVIVDAATGTVLWRKNLTEDQSQPAVYDVFINPAAMINVARNPFPVAPYPLAPNGLQGARLKLRSVQRTGNEVPYGFNQLGWITDGGSRTDGNAVQAGLDRDGTDGIDPNSEAVSITREFRFAYHPVDPRNNNGEAPVPGVQTYPGSAFQQGAVTQLFYVSNWFHDETYRLGFTEEARNFQNVNFLGQGLGGDRIRAEAQDSLSTNNANFTTLADGNRGRMQMYIFTGPNPDIDGSLDADTVVHELTHGLSNRLHGNASGLSLDMARGMGEGWSDFFALSMLGTPSDPVNGVYPTSTYVAYRNVSSPSFVNNNYYGMRRFPYAVKAAVGPNGKPHNPLTFADIDQTKVDLSDGAFPRGPVGSFNADEVHNIGEVWCSALWEIRARMMQRLGNEVGNRRMLQFVVDGMKLAPLNPTPLTERDAMIAGASASGTAADVADMWAGFAIRGLGASASIQTLGGSSLGGTGTARVTEAFDLPNVSQSPGLTITDTGANNNGVPEPAETVTIIVPLTNNTGIAAVSTTLELVGSGTKSYGTIAHGGTVAQSFAYTIPPSAVCGDIVTLTLNANSSLGPASFTRTFALGSPVTTFTESFDSITPPSVPAGWTVTSSLASMTFVSTAASADTPANSMFAADPTVTGGSTELTSPTLPITAPAATVTFRHSYNSEPGWDGGVLEISIAGAAFQDIIAAGGTFLQNGYNDFLSTSTGNPMGNRPGWSGNSGGYITSIVRLPASAAGQSVQLRWRFGADRNTAPAGGGWNVDTIRIAGSYTCSPALGATLVPVSGRLLASRSRGLLNASVTLTNEGGKVMRLRTGSRGSFVFPEVEIGHTYVLSVISRRFAYNPQKLEVIGPVADLEIAPE